MSFQRNEPMWHCYECNAQMRPLMMPDPRCASCNGTFVEKIEDENDDPRNFQADPLPGEHVHILNAPEASGGGTAYESVDPAMRLFHMLLGGTMTGSDGNVIDPSNARRQGSEPAGRGSADRAVSPPRPGTGASSTSSRTVRWGVGNGQMGVTFGYSSSSGGAGGDREAGNQNAHVGEVDDIPPLHQFLQRAFPAAPHVPNTGNTTGAGTARNMHDHDNHEGPVPLLQQYLRSLFGGFPGAGSGGLGALPGQMGDYALNGEALDAIITQLMENNPNNHRPVPAPDDMVASLKRTKITIDSELLSKDCAVCKDEFEVNQEVINLPCKHAFHDECILPWLSSSGTCPVCRHQLVPQPGEHAPPPPGSAPGGQRYASFGHDGGVGSRPGQGQGSGEGNSIPGAWSAADLD